MMKGKVVIVIAILVIAVIITGVSLWQQTGKLGAARSEVASLKDNVSTLKQNVSTLEGTIADLKGKLPASETEVINLKVDLDRARSETQAQQKLNAALSTELTRLKNPKHFASLAELTEWVQKDDTNTKYAGVLPLQRAFILEAKALRDGFLLPVNVTLGSTTAAVVNTAVIGDTIWNIRASDDFIERRGEIIPPIATTLPIE